MVQDKVVAQEMNINSRGFVGGAEPVIRGVKRINVKIEPNTSIEYVGGATPVIEEVKRKIEPNTSSGSVGGATPIMGDAKMINVKIEPTTLDNDIVAVEPGRMRSHRHTPEQIQEMHKLFKECSHPTDEQRKELAAILGMEPNQVKFWFQNKRNKMKNQHEHTEIVQLRRENDQLKNDNLKYRKAMANAACAICGHSIHVGELSREEFHLNMENVVLRKEIERISKTAATNIGKPPMSPP